MEPRLSIDKVAELYGVSRKTIWKWRCDCGMPCRQVPNRRKFYFLKSDLDQWDIPKMEPEPQTKERRRPDVSKCLLQATTYITPTGLPSSRRRLRRTVK
jgi:predicted DNA-binding transcriptional regulator AlpA